MDSLDTICCVAKSSSGNCGKLGVRKILTPPKNSHGCHVCLHTLRYPMGRIWCFFQLLPLRRGEVASQIQEQADKGLLLN